MTVKKVILFLLCLMLLFTFACSGSDNKEKIDDTEKEEETEYIGFKYSVLSGRGELFLETNNMYEAILAAGSNSLMSDKYSVRKNPDEEIIYLYSSSNYYKYRGDTYCGQDTSLSAVKEWSKQYPDSYVINGKATEFVALGESIMEGSITEFERGRELNAGSYAYMFSKTYTQAPGQTGYSYISFTLRLSEARLKYQKTQNEHGWNAYIFVNCMLDNPWQNCDIGIMNGWENYKGEWYPVFNYNGTMVNPQGSECVTKMLYDEDNDEYYGTDDLFFEIYADSEKYVLNIENLTTEKSYTFTQTNSRLSANVQKTYLLLAASYCPVQKSGAIWNPRNGAAFKNIIFENVKTAQYTKNYESAAKTDFFPGSAAWNYGFAFGADNATVTAATHSSGGTYKSGLSYSEGDKIITADISYN